MKRARERAETSSFSASLWFAPRTIRTPMPQGKISSRHALQRRHDGNDYVLGETVKTVNELALDTLIFICEGFSNQPCSHGSIRFASSRAQDTAAAHTHWLPWLTSVRLLSSAPKHVLPRPINRPHFSRGSARCSWGGDILSVALSRGVAGRIRQPMSALTRPILN
jgi:hypothetical protein